MKANETKNNKQPTTDSTSDQRDETTQQTKTGNVDETTTDATRSDRNGRNTGASATDNSRANGRKGSGARQ